MEAELILYKLIILYMLEKVDFPLTNSNFTQFIIDEGYTNYFNVQQSISELIDQKLIRTSLVRNATQYLITQEGKETLELFHNKLSDGIKHDIGDFFVKNKIEMRNETSIYADYVPEKDNEYTVNCFIKERSVTLFSLSINVLSEDHAKTICKNWREQSDGIYLYVSNKLLQ